MSITESMSIPIYNYNENNICITTNIMTHILPPAVDDTPSVDFLSFAEINYVNGISDCFRTGLVQFAEDDKEEIFKALGISNWNNIITNKEIKDILLNPSVEGLQKILDITNTSIFDRVRTIFISLKENDNNDLSNRVIKIVEARGLELRRGIYKTKIVLKSKDIEKETISAQTINAIIEQNAVLKQQIAEMQSMIASMNSNATNVKENNETIKKVGRPSSKSKQ
jgi:hypothetical protein